MGTIELAQQAPHLLEPVEVPAWLITFMLAAFSVYLFDSHADKIPGVKNLPNRVAQILTLLALAGAVTALSETPLINSLSGSLTDLFSRLGTGFSLGANIAGIVAGAVLVGWLAWRYMESEKIFFDGIFFAVAVIALATLIPWVGWITEFVMFSLVVGIQNLLVIILSWLFDRQIT